jgi:hypothetical protein
MSKNGSYERIHDVQEMLMSKSKVSLNVAVSSSGYVVSMIVDLMIDT